MLLLSSSLRWGIALPDSSASRLPPQIGDLIVLEFIVSLTPQFGDQKPFEVSKHA